MEKIVILTGAGISAESGLGTFRGAGGLWENHRVEDVATPEAFARDPKLVTTFYNQRRAGAATARPNAAHAALATLQRDYDGEVIIVTQNVDGLHEAAGAEVLHMHGQLDQALCAACGHQWPAPMEMQVGEVCPSCGGGFGRPDIVWFGEMPYHMDEIFEHLVTCGLFAAIGTSGQVYPAAGFVREADAAGAHTIELNLDPSSVVSQFAETRFGPATQTVPDWVRGLLG
ncbi:NAD-dependent deacylase [Pseudooceanicola sp. 502str34]